MSRCDFVEKSFLACITNSQLPIKKNSLKFVLFQACAHTYFDELREPGTKLPSGRDLPPLFNFTDAELKIQPTLNSQLIPSHMAGPQSQQSAGAAGAAGESASGAGGAGGADSDPAGSVAAGK